MTRTTRIVALVVVVGLVLAAVGAGVLALVAAAPDPAAPGRPASVAPTADPQPRQRGAGRPPSQALARFYSQRLDWQACDSLLCATLTVPVDYRDPGGETIEIALNQRPAGDPARRIGPLVVNPGGPGAPGTDYVEQADFAFRDQLLDRFDLIGFDPRGTGGSAPVDCLTDDQLTEFLAADPDPDDAAEGRAYAAGQEAFFDGCVARSGALIGHVTTAETARDMDVLRAALGRLRLDYFGASYGTKLGATYADLFPAQVGHAVLDGAVDVTLGSRELGLGQAAGFERALRAYVDNCLEVTDDCFLGDTVEEGLATITGLLGSVESEPLPTGLDDRELAVGSAFLGLIAPLYNRDNWTLLSQGLRQALDGDGSTLLLLADFYASREGDTYTDNSAEAIYAINCLDDPFSLGPDEVPGQYDDFERASPTLGRVFAWGLVGCRGIEVASTEPDHDLRAEGAAPILVTGTTRDPATPYEWAVGLAEHLESGVLLTRDGDGHTAYNSGNECVDEAIEAYLVDDVVPDDGLEC